MGGLVWKVVYVCMTKVLKSSFHIYSGEKIIKISCTSAKDLLVKANPWSSMVDFSLFKPTSDPLVILLINLVPKLNIFLGE